MRRLNSSKDINNIHNEFDQKEEEYIYSLSWKENTTKRDQLIEFLMQEKNIDYKEAVDAISNLAMTLHDKNKKPNTIILNAQGESASLQTENLRR